MDADRNHSIVNQLMLTLNHYREYRTLLNLALDYQLSESSVNKTIKWLEQILIKHPDFSLPSKRELWQNDDIEIILIDATEIPRERPEKSKEDITQKKKKHHTLKTQLNH